MPAHFLLTSAARTLSLASVARMSDEEAERVFIRLRWADNGGEPCCPHCGCPTVYIWRAAERCTPLALQSLPEGFLCYERHLVRLPQDAAASYLMAVAIFCNEVKGKSMLALSRDLGTQYKTVLRPSAQDAGSDGGGNAGARMSATRTQGGGRWRLFRRLRQAGEPSREPPRPPPADEPVRQAQGRGRDPRAQRQDPAGRVPQRGGRGHLYPQHSSRHKPSYTPTRRGRGTNWPGGSRCTGSTIRKPTASATRRRRLYEQRLRLL